MAVRSKTLEVRGLGKRKLSELAARAKRMGMTPEGYVRQLVEENLEVAREAQERTFSEIMGRGGEVDEKELDRLVEASKRRHQQRVRRKK